MSTISKKISNLPASPGVYLFKDKAGDILYIGKAASLKDRVRSYFSGTNNCTRPIEHAIDQVCKIETRKTDTVLEAYFLEQELIKKHQPKYNVLGKDDRSFVYVCVTKEEFPRFEIKRKTDLEQIANGKLQITNKNQIQNSKFKRQEYRTIYGPYGARHLVETALKILRKVFPYHSKKQKTEKGCLDFQLGLCPGPYAKKISPQDYKKNIRGIEMIFKGKKKMLVKQLEREMKEHSKKQEFEKATEKRNQLFSLLHIQDVALLNEDRPVIASLAKSKRKKYRIEGYDISNIGGKFNVGSMVVFEGRNGNIEPASSQYRKFKIKTLDGADDVGAMREILQRRLGNDWQLPDLVILDGGKGQLGAAVKELEKSKLEIPVLAVAKGPARKKLEIHSHGDIPRLPKKVIAQVRDEAHRFAVNYHKKLRTKDLLG